MVELHGWALIRENFTVDSEDEHTEQIVSRLSREIEKLEIDENMLRIDYCNGEAVVTGTKIANHFSDDIREMIDFFKRITLVAPGSYGLLYLHNDEDTNGFDNAFQVFVMAKGTVKRQRDPFLSPYIPTVEDI
ncbi:MAG: immunity 7 family protein [Candidatus Gastranaerophilales bacterium]|nr:immunity 7 family protein [Candidatus Gastranaerophilales bacterium]